MFTPNTFSGQAHRFSFIGGEARLCYELNPTEMITAERRIQENPAIQGAIKLYDDEFRRHDHPELTRGQDRAYFFSLLIAGMSRDASIATAIGNRSNDGFAPFESLQLLPLGTLRPSEADLARAGARLRRIFTQLSTNPNPPDLVALHPSGTGATDAELGQAYFDARNWWMREWTRPGGNVHDRGAAQLPRRAQFDALIHTPIELYRTSRATLDRILRDKEILIPGGSTAGSPGSTRLSGREYAGLLALVWKDRAGEVETDAANGLPGLQNLLKRAVAEANSFVRKAQDAYDSQVHAERGPRETIEAAGITPGNLSIAYTRLRRVQPASVLPAGPAAPGVIRSPVLRAGISDRSVITTVQPANTWRGRENARQAIPFLSEHLPVTDENRRFVESLRVHYGNDAERKTGEANLKQLGRERLTAENTLSVLHLIIDMLTAHETVDKQSSAETEELRKRVQLTKQASEFLGNMADIVKDYQNDPVAAAVVVAGGYFAIKWALGFVRGKHPRWMNYAVYAGLGAVAVGMVQERRQGHAFWDGWSEEIAALWKGDNALPPEQRTYANYWSQRLNVPDRIMARKCMSVLQNRDVREVCSYYNAMRQWKAEGGRRDSQPPLRPEFLTEINRDREALFGQMTDQQIGEEIYKTLGAFFKNRGEEFSRQGMEYVGRQNDPEATGYEDIRERYDGGMILSRIVEGRVVVRGLNRDDQGLIATWEGTPNGQTRLRQLQNGNPQEQNTYRLLLALRGAYIEEQRPANRRTAPEKWREVMFFEMDAGDLERMGRPGTQAAGILRRIQRGATDLIHQNSPFEPPQPDRSDRVQLLRNGSAERRLLTSNTHLGGGRFGQLDLPAAAIPSIPLNIPVPFMGDVNVNTPAFTVPLAPERKVIIEALQQDWEQFLNRVPVTEDARKVLITQMQGRIKGWSGTMQELLLENEQKKYELLIAAANDPARLSKGVIDRLSAPNAMNAPNWIRWFFPPEQANFPAINSLENVQDLFNINVSGNGSAPGFAWWMNIFPRWRGDQFEGIRKQIEDIRTELAQLRELPDLALPGTSGPTGSASVDRVGTLMARKIANHLIELTLYTLTTENSFIPDTLNNRRVEDNESASLGEYIADVRGNLLASNASERLQAFNKRADEVQNQWRDGNLRVIVTNGQVRIAMNTGAALPGRFLTIAQVAALAPEQVRFLTAISGMTASEFLARTPADAVDAWKQAAFTAHETQAEAAPFGGGLTGFLIERTGNQVTMRQVAAGPAATSTLARFLALSKQDVHTKFASWLNTAAANRPADPLA